MSRLRALPSGAWVAIGLVIGSILAPAAAVAATNLVGVVGGSGARAGVTTAGQLKTAEASPGSMQVYRRNGVVSGQCSAVTTGVGARGYVIKQIVFDVYDDPNPGTNDFLALYTNSGCSSQPIATVTPLGVSAWVYPIDPGFAIRAGGGLWVQAFDQVKSNVAVYGYTVPATDVPFTTPIATPSP